MFEKTFPTHEITWNLKLSLGAFGLLNSTTSVIAFSACPMRILSSGEDPRWKDQKFWMKSGFLSFRRLLWTIFYRESHSPKHYISDREGEIVILGDVSTRFCIVCHEFLIFLHRVFSWAENTYGRRSKRDSRGDKVKESKSAKDNKLISWVGNVFSNTSSIVKIMYLTWAKFVYLWKNQSDNNS